MNRPRWRLASQLTLVLCAVASFSAALVLSFQERSLSADLERAAQQRLERAASAASQLLDGHLEAMAARYQAISRTPELRANLEIDDGPTLRFHAEQMAERQGAATILFLDAAGRTRVRSGDEALARDARAALAGADGGGPAAPGMGNAREDERPETRLLAREDERPETRLLAREGRLYALAATPLWTGDRMLGHLVAVEPIADRTVERWSELCGATVGFEPGGGPPRELEVVLTRLGDHELRVTGSLEAERAALRQSHRRLAVAGVMALGFAFLVSFVLARRLVRPILELQDATERIGRGDLDVRLDAGRGDEIGDVARAFNHMTERLRATLRDVRYLAYHDSLTGLGNRRRFEERLGLALEQARREQTGVAVLFIDLDHFKYVNDTLGHRFGDALLKEMADRILGCLEARARDDDPAWDPARASVSRLGGDEFTVLLPGIRDPQVAGRVARRVLEVLSRPFRHGGHEVTIGGSIGIATHPEDGQDVETLLRECDTAMYHAKQQGRNRYQFFATYMNEIAANRLRLENELRRAIERDELRLHYQPKVELETGRIAGFEALARWRASGIGTVPPAEFVALAEDCGLIHPMGDWVLRTAVRQLAEWRRAGLPPLRVAVNLSPQQMKREGLVERIASILAEAGVEADCLEVEITESVLLDDEESAIGMLRELRALGVHISLDDFGTGYSSLSYLRRLPIDSVKIDRSFIRDAAEDPEDAAMTSAMISLARVLQLRVVAEGVETEAQRGFLREVGCHEIQGFLISSAVAPDEVPALVETLGGLVDRKPPARRALA